MRHDTPPGPRPAVTIRDKRLDVVGIGYCVYDILSLVPRVPDFDDSEMAHVSDLVFDGGGPVGTALTALARLGAHTGYLGLLGDDDEGLWLREQFLASQVDLSRMRPSPGTGTNICIILVDQISAGRAILCHKRVAPDALELTALDREYIQSARVLHLDGQFMPAAIRAAGWARDAGVKICFDGNHPRRGLDRLLPLVDWLIVAGPFPQAFTGCPDTSEAASALLALGPELLVVTEAESGCQVWTAEERFRSPGFPVPAVDTTGAGDAFHGAFIYALLQGWNLPQCARFANAAAAINCLTLGARRGLPTLQDVLELISTHPVVSPAHV